MKSQGTNESVGHVLPSRKTSRDTCRDMCCRTGCLMRWKDGCQKKESRRCHPGGAYLVVYVNTNSVLNLSILS